MTSATKRDSGCIDPLLAAYPVRAESRAGFIHDRTFRRRP